MSARAFSARVPGPPARVAVDSDPASELVSGSGRPSQAARAFSLVAWGSLGPGHQCLQPRACLRSPAESTRPARGVTAARALSSKRVAVVDDSPAPASESATGIASGLHGPGLEPPE